MKIHDKTSKVIQVDKKQKGVRTAIPSDIRKFLDIKAGDTLNWESHVKNEEKYVKIKKQE